ncbi:MAG: hypothetical protein P1U89_26140 [Verrucomicrobiales bacterium]|nr:hypothetical protein [Verrucomicrobiales bacterium]
MRESNPTERPGEISFDVIYRGICDLKKWPLLAFLGVAVLSGVFLLNRQTRVYEATSQLWSDRSVQGLTRIVTEQSITGSVEPLLNYSEAAMMILLNSREFQDWALASPRYQEAIVNAAGDEALKNCFTRLLNANGFAISVSPGASPDIIQIKCVSVDPNCSSAVVELVSSLFIGWLDFKRLEVLEKLALYKQEKIKIYKEQVAPESPTFLSTISSLENELVNLRALKLIPQNKVSILSRSGQVRAIVSPSRTSIVAIPILIFLFLSSVYLAIAVCRKYVSERSQCP